MKNINILFILNIIVTSKNKNTPFFYSLCNIYYTPKNMCVIYSDYYNYNSQKYKIKSCYQLLFLLFPKKEIIYLGINIFLFYVSYLGTDPYILIKNKIEL